MARGWFPIFFAVIDRLRDTVRSRSSDTFRGYRRRRSPERLLTLWTVVENPILRVLVLPTICSTDQVWGIAGDPQAGGVLQTLWMEF